jgi:hypothetical protein
VVSCNLTLDIGWEATSSVLGRFFARPTASQYNASNHGGRHNIHAGLHEITQKRQVINMSFFVGLSMLGLGNAMAALCLHSGGQARELRDTEYQSHRFRIGRPKKG